MRRLLLLLLTSLSLIAETVHPQVIKTPFESIDLSIDFINRICPPPAGSITPVASCATGITLTGVTAVLQPSDTDSTSSIIVQASPAPGVVFGTQKVSFRVQAGTPNQSYLISIKISNATTGEKLEGAIILKISPN